MNGRKSLRFVKASGEHGALLATSVLGEDGEHIPYKDCTFDCTLSTNHLSAPVIRADAPERILAMYALPASNAFVSATATSTLVSNGIHEIVRTWKPCPECGAEHDPPVERWTVDTKPHSYDWTSEGAGTTTNSNTWAGLMSKGTDQTITFDVIGQHPCAECVCRASTNTLVDVHELSITNDLYVGLDRTDAERSNVVTRTATANIRPLPSGRVAYSWTDCGKICTFTGRTDQTSVRYYARNSGDASDAHLAEPLTVMASITNVYGLSASATCTTNFTVVKVDVMVDGVGEDKEEVKGAFVYCEENAGAVAICGDAGVILKPVSIRCHPEKLPAESDVEIMMSPNTELFVEHVIMPGATGVMRAEGAYPAHKINSYNFLLRVKRPSSKQREDYMGIIHIDSGARDKAIITSCACFLEIDVDRPEDGSGEHVKFNDEGDVGHAFCRIICTPDSLISEDSIRILSNRYCGFYPIDTITLDSPSTNGYFCVDDTNHLAGVDVRKSWVIDVSEVQKALRFCNDMKLSCEATGNPNYHLFKYNCINVVKQVADEANVVLEYNPLIYTTLTFGNYLENLP